MQIRTIEPIPVSLPMRKPVQMAGETITTAENVLVRIESSTGLVGWGEAASAPTMTGETVASMMAAIAYMAAVLNGRPVEDLAGAMSAMDWRLYGNSGAKAAIEIALCDLLGRATGEPLYVTLGGKRRERIPVLAVIGSTDPAADVEDALRRQRAGYRAFKIKVGLGAPLADASRTRLVCEALKSGDPDCIVSADANQGFDVEAALAYVRAVGDCGLDFFEQPVAAHDIGGMARIAAATTIPIGADEGIHSPNDIERHHALRAARGASLKAIKLGGIRALCDVAGLCDRLGMAINISCKTGESSVASAAATHAACAVPAVAWGLTVTNPALAEDVVAVPLRIERGHVAPPDGPGLGVEVDEPGVRRRQKPFKSVA